jgi:hypothetical protein
MKMTRLITILCIGFSVQDLEAQHAVLYNPASTTEINSSPGFMQKHAAIYVLPRSAADRSSGARPSIRIRAGGFEYATETVPVEVKEDKLIYAAAQNRKKQGLTELRLALADIDFLINTTRFYRISAVLNL